jgi:hypothetical protein
VQIESKRLGSVYLEMRGGMNQTLTNHMAQEGALVCMVLAYTSSETKLSGCAQVRGSH